MQFITADFIFDGDQFLPPETTLVVNNNGIIEEIIFDKPNEEIQYLEGCILPGFVNTHCHLELSHLKNCIPEKTGLVDFLLAINDKRNSYSIEEKMQAIEDAEHEMITNGIVAVGDISNGLDSFHQKEKQNLQYHTFVECVGLQDYSAQERFNFCESIWKQFQTLHNSSIVLHAPYSVSDSLIELVNQAKHKLRTIHNQESDQENVLFEQGDGDFLKLFKSVLGDTKFFMPSGKNSMHTWLPKVNYSDKLILVHNTFSSEEDLMWANQIHQGLIWCVCPAANLYIENTLPDVLAWRKYAPLITIGTDSLASNHQLSILHEIQILHKYFPSIPLQELFQWATLNGAIALNMHGKIGSFLKGKQPGIIQIENMRNKNQLPEYPILKRIV